MRLYNIDNKILRLNETTNQAHFFVKSNHYFGIEILEGSAMIYSVLGPDDYSKGTHHANNNHYTIYLKSDIKFRVYTDSKSSIYEVKFKNETPNHYNDIIVNNNLPTYEEIIPALIRDDNDILKKLLLDFKVIMRRKGTLIGIEKFLNLIGFHPDSIKLYAEYITPNGNKTINPDTTIDIKTGDYYVIFNNYIDDGLTPKNLPKRLIDITDLEEFFERLYYALSIANTYFTLPEQDLAFFGLNYSANSEQYLSITSRPTAFYEFYPHRFANNIRINVYNFINGDRSNIVYDNVQTEKNILYKSKIVYKPINDLSELYLIDYEIFGDTEEFDIRSIFGNIVHMEIMSPNTWIEYEIYSDSLAKIKQERIWIGDDETHKIEFVANRISKHYIVIKITDNYNNQEVYTYDFSVSRDISNIDFDMINTVKLGESKSIDLLNTQSETDIETENFQLPLTVVNELNDLSEYYLQNPEGLFFLNNSFQLRDINKNFIVNDSTEMPVDYMDNWIDIYSFPIVDNLMIHKNGIYYSITDFEFSEHLFVTEMLIEDQKYIFITTLTTGIDLSIFNFVNKTDTGHEEITPEFRRLELYHNIPLFHREYSNIQIGDSTIETVYHKLTPNNFSVKLGDLIVCKPILVISDINIEWVVRNAFTDEILYTSNEYYLKYRVEQKLIYKVELKFNLRNEPNNNFQVIKESLFSSL